MSRHFGNAFAAAATAELTSSGVPTDERPDLLARGGVHGLEPLRAGRDNPLSVDEVTEFLDLDRHGSSTEAEENGAAKSVATGRPVGVPAPGR